MRSDVMSGSIPSPKNKRVYLLLVRGTSFRTGKLFLSFGPRATDTPLCSLAASFLLMSGIRGYFCPVESHCLLQDLPI